MQRKKLIEILLESACASIKYRIRREILEETISPDELQVLQGKILQDAAVKEIIISQSPDGWLGKTFHGYNSLEGGIRYLCEKGVNLQHPVLTRALLALETNTERIVREMGKVGKVLDDRGFGGTSMIRAATLVYAGVENKNFVQEQVKAALEGFQEVLAISGADEITEPYKGKIAFRPGVRWPGIYHFRLLAFTHQWRTPQHHKLVVEAIKRLVALSPIPYIYVRYKSQVIAPAAFAMQDFNPVMASMSASQWMMWFHRTELLARLGVVGMIPELKSQVDTLREILDDGKGLFTKPINHAYFKHWGAYTGLMLEQNWRLAQRRISDLTFRSLLIQHYSNDSV